MKLKFEAFACQGTGQAGNWETRYVPPCPFPSLPPIRPPARSGSDPPPDGGFIGQSSPLGPSVLPGSQPDRASRAVTDLDQTGGRTLGPFRITIPPWSTKWAGGFESQCGRTTQEALEGWHFGSGLDGGFLIVFSVGTREFHALPAVPIQLMLYATQFARVQAEQRE